MRLLGLDYGAKTVGVAVTDPLHFGVSPLETIFRDRESALRKTCQRIEELVLEYDPALIVLGNPLNMNGTVGERAEKVLAFKEMLERRLSVPVVLMDERLTTREAAGRQMEAGIPFSERKKNLDAIAAAVILEDYLENHRNQLKEKEQQKGT